MADWDSLIAEETAQNTELRPEVKQSDLSSSTFAFGDALEKFTEENLKNQESKIVSDPLKITAHKLKREKDETAGKNWFNMPKSNLTEEEKRDWQILHMRSVWEKGAKNVVQLPEQPPEFVQFGVIHTHAMDGNKAKLSRKQRAPTIAEMLAKDDSFQQFINDAKKKQQSKANAFNK